MMTTAKRYELQVDGRILENLSEAEVRALYRRGRIFPFTACRPVGHEGWQELNEFLPLLKYEQIAKEEGAIGQGEVCVQSVQDLHPLKRRQWRLGASCFAAGVLCAGTVVALPMMVGFSEGTQRRAENVIRAEPIEVPLAVQEALLVAQTSARQRRLGSGRTPGAGTSVNRARPAAHGLAQLRSGVSSSTPPKPKVGPEEATISLEKWTTVRSTFGEFRVKIREEGPSTISVWTGYSDEPRRVEKVKGFEAYGTNKVQIDSLPGAKLYYVDRLTAPIGHCVVKVVPEEES